MRGKHSSVVLTPLHTLRSAACEREQRLDGSRGRKPQALRTRIRALSILCSTYFSGLSLVRKPFVGGAIVRDVYEVLREKEKGLEQVRREVEAVRLAVPLVNESEGSP